MADPKLQPSEPAAKASEPAKPPQPPPSDDPKVREQAAFARRLAADDAAREQSPDVTLVATAGFTLVDDPGKPEGRVVQPKEEFTIKACDLHRYLGRGAPKALEAGKPGVNVQQASE